MKTCSLVKFLQVLKLCKARISSHEKEFLAMRKNFFQGDVPSSLESLRGLEHLDLSKNNFSGEIPKFLENFKFLKLLNLSYNNFDGEVPTIGVFRNSSAISIRGNGKLCGGIPKL